MVGTCQGSSGTREELWAPFRCCGEGRGQAWHPRPPMQDWQEVTWGCPCAVPTVAAQPSLCVSLGLQEPLGCRSWGELGLHPEGPCWEPVLLGGSLGHLLPPWRVRTRPGWEQRPSAVPVLGGCRSWGRDGLLGSRLS